MAKLDLLMWASGFDCNVLLLLNHCQAFYRTREREQESACIQHDRPAVELSIVDALHTHRVRLQPHHGERTSEVESHAST